MCVKYMEPLDTKSLFGYMEVMDEQETLIGAKDGRFSLDLNKSRRRAEDSRFSFDLHEARWRAEPASMSQSS